MWNRFADLFVAFPFDRAGEFAIKAAAFVALVVFLYKSLRFLVKAH